MNFFENNFTQEFGEMYIGEESNASKKRNKEEFLTPNSVSSGNLPKMWIKEKTKLYMIKGSELNIIQEPFNEKIISDYLQTLGINHVVYDVIQHNNKPYKRINEIGVTIKARIDAAVKRLQGSRGGIDYGRSSKVEKENVVRKGRKG